MSEASCGVCGKQIWQPTRCRGCGKVFCRDHLPRDKHACAVAKQRSGRELAFVAGVALVAVLIASVYLYGQRQIIWQRKLRDKATVECLIRTSDGY